MLKCLDGYPERFEEASAVQGRVTLSPIGSSITPEEEASALSIRYEDCQPVGDFIKEMEEWEKIIRD